MSTFQKNNFKFQNGFFQHFVNTYIYILFNPLSKLDVILFK